MKRLIIVSACLLFLISCEENTKPKGLLSQDKMVNVLIDIQITEGIASALPIAYDSSQVLYKLLEKEVFMKHQVEDSVFIESLRYYLQYPAIMDKMYAQIIDSLASKEIEGIKKDDEEIF